MIIKGIVRSKRALRTKGLVERNYVMMNNMVTR